MPFTAAEQTLASMGSVYGRGRIKVQSGFYAMTQAVGFMGLVLNIASKISSKTINRHCTLRIKPF